jgi:hypothetical protein
VSVAARRWNSADFNPHRNGGGSFLGLPLSCERESSGMTPDGAPIVASSNVNRRGSNSADRHQSAQVLCPYLLQGHHSVKQRQWISLCNDCRAGAEINQNDLWAKFDGVLADRIQVGINQSLGFVLTGVTREGTQLHIFSPFTERRLAPAACKRREFTCLKSIVHFVPAEWTDQPQRLYVSHLG